jgi:hypothetical protein
MVTAATDFASSINGVRLRITPLETDGTKVASGHVLVTEGFITASLSPEYEDGDEIAEKAANGQVCISWKSPDTLKRVTVGLSVCSPDPEVTAMLAGGQVLWSATDEIIGYAAPAAGGALGDPVAIEIWSIANSGGKPAAGLPYWRWVIPYATLRFEGDREFGNGALVNEFSGWGVGNSALVMTDWTYGGLDRPFAYVREASVPAVGWTGTPLVAPA